MNLNDFNTHSSKVKRFEKITESKFGRKINFDTLTIPTAIKLVKKLDEGLQKMRQSTNHHNAHKSAAYSETLLVKEGLDDWLHIQLGINHKRKRTSRGSISSKRFC
jgi:hypothetical protein